MNLPRPLLFLARVVFLVYVILSAGYCLLSYIPFTYQQINLGGLLPWVTTFTRLHAWLFLPAWGVAILSILPDLKGGPARPWALAFAATGAVAGIALLVHPVLPALANDRSSLLWLLVFLLPCLWLAAIDWIFCGRALRWRNGAPESDTRIFHAAWQSALFVSLVYGAIVAVREFRGRAQHFGPSDWLWALAWSLASHLLLFLVAFVLLALLGAAAGLAGDERHPKLQLLGSALFAVVAVWLILRSIVFLPLSFAGARADGIALATAVALVAYSLGTSVRMTSGDDEPLASGLALFLRPFRFLEQAGWPARFAFLAALALVVALLQARVVVFDWEYLLQKLIAAVFWTVAFAAFYALAARAKPRSPWLMYGIAAAVLAAYLALANVAPRQATGDVRASEVAGLLDDYADYDVSFRIVDDIFARAPSDSGGASAFYSFLADNTSIPRSHHVDPVEVNLVQNWNAAGPRPNIFVFVIDSLRRDYLAPYNTEVDFTPAVAAFARDSVVLQNAFTRYGGTNLSEPAIWVGGLMLHKQYVTPFEPMNALQKLLQRANYQEWVSRDSILETVLGSSPGIEDLDVGRGTMNLDFCATLNEVEERLSARNDPRPLFVYSQPQNIHVSVIDREGRSTLPGAPFGPSFDPPYASRIRRLDGCFGQFLDTLKRRSLYDNSVIILTSDHGDSLGERGRWGHAYALFPEVVRVPLIVHLPPAMRAQLSWDPHATAFLTDITPSLYYLLGQRPIVRNGIFGRPLFSENLAEQKNYEASSYLITSSYAPVYGVLSGNGRELYVVDGVNYKDYYFEVESGRVLPVTDVFRERQQEIIRQQVTAIARFYNFR